MTEVIEDRHKLGWGLAALVVAGNMIGSGVYLLPATLAPVGSSSVVGWGVAGLGAVTLALVFAALGRLQPDADGLSGFAERGLGRFFGFQTALAFWTACLVGNVAIAVAATGYLGFFFPVLKEPVAATFCNLGLIWLTTGAYILGARAASRFAALALIIGLVPVVIAVAAGVSAFSGETFADSWSPSGNTLAESVPASLAVIFWAFLGVETAAVLSVRVKNPARDVGRASIAGVLLAAIVYVAATVAVFGVIPAGVLAESSSPYADLTARVFGASLGGLVAVCAVIKAVGTLGGWVMLGGETARAAARSGYLPSGFGHGERTPVVNPLLGGAIMSIVAVLTGQPTLGGQFGMLVGVTSVLSLVVYGLCSASLFRLARWTRARFIAALGLLFATAAVVAAAPGYILPTAIFFAVTTAAWVAFMRGKPVNPVDPAAAAH
ncbi:MAG: amino acid permease [Alphaproteobacteria bacterium]|jgi:arginine:agmatine antiporter|nr:amino acid permease [Alphaproteobacteria bacterium]MBU2042755.1 amino acid permease [Alphaproteobacteria bacterium]MBU2126517.1 amino acid permease [Alphaproteobacteria bacterium]MBU2208410.1 amino acid permease [Alphaproteobacteria bacterium]MBU2290503.1 amino acid permease [Alphaproteobacteria bacterium]